MDSDCLKHLEAKLADQETEQQSSGTTQPFDTAAAWMSRADQINVSRVVTHLTQLQTKREDATQQDTAASPSPASTRTDVRKDMKSHTRDTKVSTTDKMDNMMAVDIHKVRAVWVLEDSKWMKLCDVPTECPNDGCICLVSDDIVIVHEDLTLSFSLSTKQWKKLTRMPTSRILASVVAIDGRVILLGGWIDGKNSKVCEILHVKHNKWSEGARLPKPLENPVVSVLAGQIYILTQKDKLSSLFRTQLLVYDPLSNNYTHRARLPRGIRSTDGACMAGVAHKLYLLGGEDDLAWQYSPHTDQWIQLVPPTGTYYSSGCCAVVKDNNILLCGGSDEGDKDEDEGRMIEEYSTVTQEWGVLDIRLPFGYDKSRSSAFIAHI